MHEPYYTSSLDSDPAKLDLDQEYKMMAFRDAEEVLITLGAHNMTKYRSLYSFLPHTVFLTPFHGNPPRFHLHEPFLKLAEQAYEKLGLDRPNTPTPSYSEALHALSYKELENLSYVTHLHSISSGIKTHKSNSSSWAQSQTLAQYSTTVEAMTSAFAQVFKALEVLQGARGKVEGLLLKFGGALIQTAANAFLLGPIANIASNYILTDVVSAFLDKKIDVTGRSSLLVDKTKLSDFDGSTLTTILEEGVGGVLEKGMGWISDSTAKSFKNGMVKRMDRLANGINIDGKREISQNEFDVLLQTLADNLNQELAELTFAPAGTAAPFNKAKMQKAHGWPFFCMVAHFLLQKHPACLAADYHNTGVQTAPSWQDHITNVTIELNRGLFTKNLSFTPVNAHRPYEAAFIKIFWGLYFASIKDEPSLNQKYHAHSKLMSTLIKHDVVVTTVEMQKYDAIKTQIQRFNSEFQPTKVSSTNANGQPIVQMSKFNKRNKRIFQNQLLVENMQVAANKSGKMGKTTLNNLITWGVAVKRNVDVAILRNSPLFDINTLTKITTTAPSVRANAMNFPS